MNDLKVNLTTWKCSPNDLVIFQDQRKFPTLDVCSQVLKSSGLPCTSLDMNNRHAGTNGDVHFTTDGKYAIKRSCDLHAQSEKLNEITRMSNVIEQMNSSNPQGFDINLPIALIQIVDETTGENAFCNIQIFPKVVTKHDEGFHEVGDLVRSIVEKGDDDKLPLIFTLGEDLAKFHQSQGIQESAKGFGIGCQHGDLGHCNILVNKNGNHTFTLIDNIDFRPRARVISDIVYFVYFNSVLFSPPITPDQIEKVNRVVLVIEQLYQGYVKCANETNLKTMERYFAHDNPILASTTGDYNKRAFLNSDNIWHHTFEKVQREAFNKAYSSRYPKIFVNQMESMDQIIESYEWTSHGGFLDLTSFHNLKYLGESLKDFTELESLNLAHTQVEDVSSVQSLTNLRELKASHINGLENISSLSKLTNLALLKLNNTSVSAIESLRTLDKLTFLDLSHTPVVWVEPLNALTNLEKLNLAHSKVDDTQSELHKLSSLKNLKELDLRGTAVKKFENFYPHISLVNITAKCDVGFGSTLGIACEPFWGENPHLFTLEPNTFDVWKGMVPREKKWKFVKVTDNQLAWEQGSDRSSESNTEVNTISF